MIPDSDKLKKKKEKQQRDKFDLLKICEKGNISLNFIKAWHFRLTKNDYQVDVFPEKKRYYDFNLDKRGKYDNLVRFVKRTFNV